jgi:2-oxoisovalerate dehydrogenase E1 component
MTHVDFLPAHKESWPVDFHPVLDSAIRIRAFENTLLDLFKQGLLSGTVHTCIGQEFCAAALHPHLKPGTDAFFATHRGHGHYLAHGGPEDQLLAELMGREGALCLGRGGTQNLCYKRFFSAGIQGGGAPIAVGYAWAMRRRGEEGIAVAQLGDGTLGEGTLYEAFTFAAWLKAPVLFLVECNGWAQSTDVKGTTPGDILQRAAGFGLEVDRATDENPVALHRHLEKVVAHVRRGNPFLQVIETRRLMAHSKGDDNRPRELVEELWRADPLARILKDEDWAASSRAAEAAVATLAQETAKRPLLDGVDGEPVSRSEGLTRSEAFHADWNPARMPGRVSEELNRALHEIMAEDQGVILIGEDLLDPYGGAFKVTRGLSTEFPERVLSTPIAEAGIAGVSNGMALAGLKPVAEIMFADFVTLAADQLINFAAKFHAMYGGRVQCPLTVRLVSGGGRGYGPTHSQSLERLFCGIPGLRVVALSQRHDSGHLLRHAVLNDSGPTVFVENKLLYSQIPAQKPPLDLRPVLVECKGGEYPALRYVPENGEPDVTVVTYGGMTGPAETALRQLIEEEEVRFEYIVLTQLWPLDVTEIAASVARTRRLVVVEENVPEYSVASAVIAGVAQATTGGFACRAVGAVPTPIPAVRHLEDHVLPSAANVTKAIRAIL